MKITIKNKEKHSQLAISVYVLAMKKQIEEEVKSKYLKRIDYLVGANNELSHELKKCEEERIKMAKIADNIVIKSPGSKKGAR